MAINFRKFLCKNVFRRGGLLWKCADCQRYDHAPQHYEDVIEESIRLDDTFEDVAPVIAKCNIPYHRTGKILVWSGAVLTDWSIKDNATWKEQNFPEYLNSLVRDGVNATRAFSWFEDNTPEWDSFKPGADGQAYWDALGRRLQMVKDRDLTAIVTMRPYRGSMSDGDIRSMVIFLMPYRPNVIIEAENEPQTNEYNERVTRIAKEYGWPVNHIQLGFVDSGEFGDTVLANPGILSCCHYVATTDTIFSNEKYGWANSPGTRRLMSLGMYGSNDGEDSAGACRGWYFYGGPEESQRPTVEQLFQTTGWMLDHGRGYEDLSAAGFRTTTTPNMIDAINYGAEERAAMRRASGL